MRRSLDIALKACEIALNYPVSLVRGHRNRRLYDDVSTYCMFIGYPRSGHTLIGSLLDAHPDMIIAHELHALLYVYAGYGRRALFHRLIANSKGFLRSGRVWNGYSYKVPSGWHGRFRKLQVIGDKKGGGSSYVLGMKPWLLKRLQRTLNGTPIKWIHVVRNPYDTITSMFLKQKYHNKDPQNKIEFYFRMCDAVLDIKGKIRQNDLFEIRHEVFIEDPKIHLRHICAFLGVEASERYLDHCSHIVFDSPRKTRFQVQWNRTLIDMVKTRMARYPFLKGYSYKDE